ncbi:pectate lyase [Amycolatopsis sp. NBC_01488]|uniref:pectate lyase n=1 Tax=Amycolatopsis sp. NBC_01488 TaxID=2903563 RepID=UPI002E27FE91|nr:pectate lyase [Amycolatopsis sp. NBC_01488]
MFPTSRVSRAAAVAALAAATLLGAGAPATAATAAAAWPNPSTSVPVGQTIKVTSGTYDGGLKRFYGTGDLGTSGQSEDQGPLFELANGTTLKNVVLGNPAADGVHCLGTCTLLNVWWEDVGEDAATFKGTSASQTMTIDGGGARKASDKVFQHNGPGTMYIRNFQVDDFGKLYRSCGNCKTQYQRNVVVDNVVATAPGKALVGINTNYGDTAKLTRITIVGDSSRKIVPCQKYRGVTSGEPTTTGSGPDSTNCLYTTATITYQ